MVFKGGYGSLWEGASSRRSKIQLERFHSERRLSLFFRILSIALQVTKRAVHCATYPVINDNSDCFWRRQNWFINCDCTNNSQNCICRFLSSTTTIWQGCLDLIISVSSTSLSLVGTIQSFSKQSLTLLDDSDITASLKNWTVTSTLTNFQDVTYSLTTDDMTSSTTDSPSVMTDDVTATTVGMNFDGSLNVYLREQIWLRFYMNFLSSVLACVVPLWHHNHTTTQVGLTTVSVNLTYETYHL